MASFFANITRAQVGQLSEAMPCPETIIAWDAVSQFLGIRAHLCSIIFKGGLPPAALGSSPRDMLRILRRHGVTRVRSEAGLSIDELFLAVGLVHDEFQRMKQLQHANQQQPDSNQQPGQQVDDAGVLCGYYAFEIVCAALWAHDLQLTGVLPHELFIKLLDKMVGPTVHQATEQALRKFAPDSPRYWLQLFEYGDVGIDSRPRQGFPARPFAIDDIINEVTNLRPARDDHRPSAFIILSSEAARDDAESSSNCVVVAHQHQEQQQQQQEQEHNQEQQAPVKAPERWTPRFAHFGW